MSGLIPRGFRRSAESIAPPVGSNGLLNSLISYWSLDESSGSRLDSHGANHLADTNSVPSVAGVLGSGVDFTDASKYLTAPTGTSLDPGTEDFSISFWAKDCTVNFINKGNRFSTDQGWAIIFSVAADSYVFRVNDFYVRSSVSAPVFTKGQWHHLIFVIDHALGKVRGYINGSSSGFTPGGGGPTSDVIGTLAFDSPEPFRLGARADLGAFSEGQLDEVGVWNRALTDDDAIALYNNGNGLSYANFDGYDLDAVDYFNRAEALGGSFNQTAIDPTYTESYVKGAINDYVVGLKADGVWDFINELYLLSGVSFAGLMAKLKYDTVPAMTNNGFVAADYKAVGAGAGLADGAGKYIATAVTPNYDESTIGMYLTEGTTVSDGRLMGAYFLNDTGFGPRPRNLRFASNSNGTIRFYGSNYEGGINPFIDSTGSTGFFIGEAKEEKATLYENGLTAGTANGAYNVFTAEIYLLGVDGLSGGDTSARLSLAVFCSDDLGPFRAGFLSARTNTLMTALGANVF